MTERLDSSGNRGDPTLSYSYRYPISQKLGSFSHAILTSLYRERVNEDEDS